MFAPELLQLADMVVRTGREKNLHLATAESCTGGMIGALLTEIPGSADVFERGFITYSNESKQSMLGVSAEVLNSKGAVSEDVARAMAEGAVRNSNAQIAVAVTGIAGPGGGSEHKPVGLVHISAAREGAMTVHQVCRFGEIGRNAIRVKTVDAALKLVLQHL